MADNQHVNKVVYGNTVLIDLTADTVPLIRSLQVTQHMMQLATLLPVLAISM